MRIRELEEENAALNGKLVRALSRVADLQAQGKGSAESRAQILREQQLEKELDSSQDRIRKAAQENKMLERTVTALRQQLTAVEAKKDFGVGVGGGGGGGDFSYSGTTGNAMGLSAAAGGVRRAQERDPLKEMLIKAKQEKDKAVRALIHIIGKDRVAAFLHKNAGAPNILDALLETFGGIPPSTTSAAGSSSSQQLSDSALAGAAAGSPGKSRVRGQMI